jgi:lipopolysaccharide transport system permease protein
MPLIINKKISPLWKFRSFILGSIKREFQTKYRNSILGIAWPILNPLVMILIYTLVFSQVMKARLPGVDSMFAYSIYLCIGIITWNLFTEITLRGQSVFLDNANLIKKLNFPKLCLPLIVIGSALLNFAIVFLIFTLFLVFTNQFPGWVYFAVIPLLLLQIAFAICLGISLGVLNVFFRDVGQFYSVFLQFWFWLTPIVYAGDILPPSIQPYLALNPMTSLVDAYHSIFVNEQWPNWYRLIYVLVLTLILSFLGYRLFQKHGGEMVDEL